MREALDIGRTAVAERDVLAQRLRAVFDELQVVLAVAHVFYFRLPTAAARRELLEGLAIETMLPAAQACHAPILLSTDHHAPRHPSSALVS